MSDRTTMGVTSVAAAIAAAEPTEPRPLAGLLARLDAAGLLRGARGDDLPIGVGGVDLPGAPRIPREGEPTYGLNEHPRSFGAEGVALAGAQERVARPWRYALGRGLSRVERLVTPGRTAR